jgi:signal transduction histidine kinase
MKNSPVSSGWWSSLKLVQQFALAAALVLVPGMAITGWWVAQQIMSAVTTNTAQAAALYMEGSVAPLIQELAKSNRLKPETIEQLDALLQHSTIRERILSMKIWHMDGTIVYSQWPDMIGRKYVPSTSFAKAAAGEVAAVFESDPHHEDHNERSMAQTLLEIYAPVRGQNSREIIAVSEFYATGDRLKAELGRATQLSWLVVAAVTCLMMAALASIVNRGSKVIDSQRSQLTAQIDSLRILLEQNEDLRQRLQQSNLRITASSEDILQKIGADLHDGPAQLLTYALLRLNRLAPSLEVGSSERNTSETEQLRMAIADSLREVRNISSGLSPPGLESATLKDAVLLAVSHHQQRTSTTVRTQIALPSMAIGEDLKLCTYRFVQEALTNAYRHAGGKDQAVIAEYDTALRLTVTDTGAGFDPAATPARSLGLSGMRARVESLGGTISINSILGEGTTISAEFGTAVLERETVRHD